MDFTYSQSTGKFINSKTDTLVGIGYSGHGAGLNDPQMQDVHNVGPIPQGKYHIAEPITDAKTGPISMHLVPFQDNEMFGRSAFLIHGDNIHMNHTASDGCIILSNSARLEIGNEVLRGNFILEVVE